jgi:hypothetical protein
VARIEHFLATLPGLSAVRILIVASRSLTLTLHSRISRSHLLRLIDLGGLLTLPETAPEPPTSGTRLNFIYRHSTG